MYEYRCKVVHIVDGDTVDVDIDLGFGVWMKKLWTGCKEVSYWNVR